MTDYPTPAHLAAHEAATEARRHPEPVRIAGQAYEREDVPTRVEAERDS